MESCNEAGEYMIIDELLLDSVSEQMLNGK